MALKPEFDNYAQDYSGGNEDPLKRFLGRDLDHFIRVKAQWLLSFLLQNDRRPGAEYRLLDYGCGTGEMLQWLHAGEFRGSLYGADISGNMLQTARKRWRNGGRPGLLQVDGTGLPFKKESFDCIVATNVFHHIDPVERDDVLEELRRVLKPLGNLVIFEHNPLNPLTRLIVKRAVIDRNAVLLSPCEIRSRLKKVKLRTTGCWYIMFSPPSLTWLTGLDRLLSWCPLGAQYAAVAVKEV